MGIPLNILSTVNPDGECTSKIYLPPSICYRTPPIERKASGKASGKSLSLRGCQSTYQRPFARAEHLFEKSICSILGIDSYQASDVLGVTKSVTAKR